MAQYLEVADRDAEIFDCDLGRGRFLFLCMETALLRGHIQNCFLSGDDHDFESMCGIISSSSNTEDIA